VEIITKNFAKFNTFLGYDVLVLRRHWKEETNRVSVAGCLGYDVLDSTSPQGNLSGLFQLLVV
jgi:hypothetical protein